MRDSDGARHRSPNAPPRRSDGEASDEPRPPWLEISGRNLLGSRGFLAAALAALYFLLPQLAGLDETWNRIEDGSPCWLVLARRASRSAMFGGYVVMFRGRLRRARDRSGSAWRESYQITHGRRWRRRGCSPPAAPAASC